MPIMVVVVFLVSLTQIYGSKAQGINWEYPPAGGYPQSQNFMSIYQKHSKSRIPWIPESADNFESSADCLRTQNISLST